MCRIHDPVQPAHENPLLRTAEAVAPVPTEQVETMTLAAPWQLGQTTSPRRS